MAKLRSFLDFEDRARPEWTVDIDLSKVEKTKAALREIDKYTKEAFSSSKINDMSFDGALKSLQTLQKSLAAVENRYKQLQQTTESLRSSAAAATGSEAQDFQRKAQAAEMYAKSLARLKQTYSDKQERFGMSDNPNAGKAYNKLLADALRAKEAAQVKETAPVAETQAPIEQMNELAEASNKAREAVIDVGNAEKSATPAPIENQKEAMDRLAESATRCAETVKEAATANASAITGGAKPPAPPMRTNAELVTNFNQSYVKTDSMDEAIAKLTNASHVYDALKNSISTLGSDAKQLGMENIFKFIDPASFQAALNSFTGGIEGFLQPIMVSKKELNDLTKEALAAGEAVQEAAKRAQEARANYSKQKQLVDAKTKDGTLSAYDTAQLQAAKFQMKEANAAYSRQKQDAESLQSSMMIASRDMSNYEPAISGNERLVSSYIQLAKALSAYQQAEVQLASTAPGNKYFNHLQGNLENARIGLIGAINEFKKLSGQELMPSDTQFKSIFSDFNQKRIEANSKMLSPQESARMNNILNGMTPYGAEGEEKTDGQLRSYEQLCQEIELINERLEKYRSLIKESSDTDILGNVETIKNAEAQLKELLRLKEAIDAKGKTPTPQVNQNQNPVNAVSDRAAQQNMFRIGGEEPEKKAGAISRAMDSIAHKSDAVIAGWNRISSAISPAISMAKGFVSVLGHIGSIGATIGKGMFNGLIAGIKGVMSLMNGVQNAFSQFGSTAKNALSTLGGLASRGFNAIRTGVSGAIGGLKNMASHMTRFTRSHTPNMLKSLQSIKSMLVRRLKRTFISSIFNQAKEALQQLARQSEGFNTAMSNIKNSFGEVAGNFAVTLGNLLQIVAPIVTTVLGWINSIIQAINALFSLISGKGTMTVAKKKTDNYAKSLKSAGGSAKELNNQLYGFDEITRQDDNSGGGGGGSSPTKFEEKAIDSIIGGDLKKKLEEIINAFKSGEFRKAGQLIGNLIAEMAEKAEKKIKELRPVAAKWARNIAQVLNGIVDSDAIRNSYKAAGQAANIVLETIYSFLDEFEFDNLGRKIADAVKHSTIEWDLVGRTLATLVNSTWSFLKGLFSNLPWKDIGSRITLGLNTAFSEINWSDIKDALRDGINGLFTTLYTILSEVKWADTAKAISENLAQLVTEIDWAKIGQTFGLGFDTAIDILDEFFKSGALSSTIKGLGTTIESALNEIDFPHLGEVAREGCTEIAKGFGNLLTEIDFEDKATKIKAGIETFFDTEHGGAAFDSAIEALTGENKGINRIIAGFKKLVDLKEGIQFEEIAKTIGDKAGELLSNINWSSLTTSLFLGRIRLKSAFWKLVSEIPFSDIAKKIAEGVNNFFAPGDSGKSPLEEAAENASKGLNNILTAFTDFLKELDLTKVRQSIANAINQFIGNVQLDKIVADIGQFVIKAAGEFANLFDPQKGVDFPALGEKLVAGFNGIFVDSATGEIKKDTFKTLGENIGKAIGGILETLDQFLQVDSGAVIEAIATTLSSINWTELIKKVLVMVGDAMLKIGDAIPQLLSGILQVIRSIDWFQVSLEILGAIGKTLWAAVKATGGIIGKFVDFLFGTGDFAEEVEIQSAEATKELQEATGKAGQNMAQNFADNANQAVREYGDEFFSSFDDEKTRLLAAADSFFQWFDPDKNPAQKKALLEAASAMALGFQEEYKTALLEQDIFDESTYQWFTHEAEKLIVEASENVNWEQTQVDWANAGITITDAFAQAITGKGKDDIGAALALLSAGVSEETIASFNIDQLQETLFGFMNSTGLSLKETVAYLQGATIDDIAAMGEHTATELGTALGKITPEALKQALVEGKVLVKEASDDMAKSATPDTQNIADGQEGGTKLGKGVESGTTTGLENGITATANSAQKLVKEGILDTLAGKEEDVTKAAESLETKAQKAFSKLPDDVKPYANDMLNYMVTAMEEGNPTVVAAVDQVAKDVVEKVKSYLNSGTGVQIASSFLDGMSQGVALHRASMINFFHEATKTARDVAQAYLSEANGETIGKNMMIGLINGLIAYSDLLVLIMATICNTTVDTAREILGIASPSKVFAEIGKYTVEGMEQGIADNGHKAVDAISDVAQSIENEGAVEMTVQSMVDGLDIVEGKMARLADIFSGIAETITSMGNFELPAMAKGQVIPYRSRVEGGTTGFGGAESSVSQSDIEDAMYSAFVRAMDNRADSQPIVINLDGRRLAEVVSRYQRQNVRSMGV